MEKISKKKYELNQWIRMSFYGNSDDEVILMTENGADSGDGGVYEGDGIL